MGKRGGPQVGPEGLTGAEGGPAGQGFKLSKHLFDRIEVGTVGRQKPQQGALLA